MADTVIIDFDALEDPANRDRVAQIERLLRQIAYSEEFRQISADGGSSIASSWEIAPHTQITMLKKDKPGHYVHKYSHQRYVHTYIPGAGGQQFADNTYGTLVADHQNERDQQREPRPQQQEEGAVGSDEPMVPVHRVRHTGPTGPAGSQEPEPPEAA